ncbi:type I-U CRISPR-associated RAMP protein Csb1/Cas7u [Nocardiopsis sp. CNT312]|uniref:type I-G CRISPR-associated RAMP protein Csb1/Cas7g n=1 Tax=Nocardiopsis sp. CNT312 TaxID=1137268 RepID=UPI00048E0F45|nr:type I-U CRISPR-associated RAMP protein Csb1/Cas7u [Nocardiopsis sp. CNT312]
MSQNVLNHLLAAVGPDRPWAGVSMHADYRPAAGDKVFPPTYPVDKNSSESPYLMEKRWMAGESSPKDVVVLDQVPSQANRVETALLEARDEDRIRLPLFELTATTSRGAERITSLEMPHRFADAYLRDSEWDGVRFDKTDTGRRLREATVRDVRALFEFSPESLVLGAWDSHRKGRQAKFPRTYSSSMVGFDPEIGERRGGRMDPTNLTGAVADSSQADWEYAPPGEKKTKGQRLSELGHGNIAPNYAHGGVAITGAQRSAWLSLAALARLRFGDASHEAARLARATLAALALAGDRLAFGGPSVWLRSGCDLVRTGHRLAFEGEDGKAEEVSLTAGQAIEVFHELRDRTDRAGIAMSEQTIALTPIPALAKAIEYSISHSTDSGE